jgi:putative DNA-invertase from lambdoid prophage Rac
MVAVVQLVNDLVSQGVRVIIIHQGIDSQNGKLEGHQKLILGIFSSLAEMERDLISLRTIEGLKIARANGRIGGRRKGVLQRSKYDKHLPRIKELLKRGLPLESILKIINEGKSKSLSNYLEKRGIRAKTKSFSPQRKFAK